MTTLFISHASEDKEAFVRPLAEALKAEFDVWYDEHSLTIGDSLRQCIDEGLRKADYGVVVLSKAFFGKKWPATELDGLLALERPARKLILPIWLGVTEAEVKSFSPLLAGRVAADGGRGVSAVVSEIRLAVSASQRTRELTGPTHGTSALRDVLNAFSAHRDEQAVLASSHGAGLVVSSAAAISRALVEAVKEGQGDRGGNNVQVRVGRTDVSVVSVHLPGELGLRTGVRDVYGNSAAEASFQARFYERSASGPDEDCEFQVIETMKWHPRWTPHDQIRWQSPDSESPIDPEAVTQEIALRMAALLKARMLENGAGRSSTVV